MAANYPKVCELALLLSHGQASVERGFSVNKELVVENQSEQTLSARRIIKDHIIHVNGVTNVEIKRNMVLSARSARAKYANYLAQQKEEQEVEKQNKKRKEETDAIHELEGKRKRLKTDVLPSFPLQRKCMRSAR